MQALGGYRMLTIGSTLDDVPGELHQQPGQKRRGGRSSEAKLLTNLEAGKTALGKVVQPQVVRDKAPGWCQRC
jgi:hypothetical protein